MRRALLAFCVAAASVVPGCMSIRTTAVDSDAGIRGLPRVYSGTIANCGWMVGYGGSRGQFDKIGWVGSCFCIAGNIIDLPLCIVADTVLLPYTVVAQVKHGSHDREKDATPPGDEGSMAGTDEAGTDEAGTDEAGRDRR